MNNIGGDTEEHGRRKLKTIERDTAVGYDMEERRRGP
jgi:hypothetical protein